MRVPKTCRGCNGILCGSCFAAPRPVSSCRSSPSCSPGAPSRTGRSLPTAQPTHRARQPWMWALRPGPTRERPMRTWRRSAVSGRAATSCLRTARPTPAAPHRRADCCPVRRGSPRPHAFASPFPPSRREGRAPAPMTANAASTVFKRALRIPVAPTAATRAVPVARSGDGAPISSIPPGRRCRSASACRRASARCSRRADALPEPAAVQHRTESRPVLELARCRSAATARSNAAVQARSATQRPLRCVGPAVRCVGSA
jgi:hypothetical protein